MIFYDYQQHQQGDFETQNPYLGFKICIWDFTKPVFGVFDPKCGWPNITFWVPYGFWLGKIRFLKTRIRVSTKHTFDQVKPHFAQSQDVFHTISSPDITLWVPNVCFEGNAVWNGVAFIRMNRIMVSPNVCCKQCNPSSSLSFRRVRRCDFGFSWLSSLSTISSHSIQSFNLSFCLSITSPKKEALENRYKRFLHDFITRDDWL